MSEDKRAELSVKLHTNNKAIEAINAQRFNQKLFRNPGEIYYYDDSLSFTDEIDLSVTKDKRST